MSLSESYRSAWPWSRRLGLPRTLLPAARARNLVLKALEQSPRPATLVRRYRDAPPLVRNADGKWRTGRLDLVLGGDFDLMQAGRG